MTLPFVAPRRSNRRSHDGRRKGAQTNVHWTLERIADGVRRFEREYGHTPSATEFDLVLYLPTLRHVHMYFGGIRQLRSALGLSMVDLSSGRHRSEMMRDLGQKGLASERVVREHLERRFGEVFVHVERKMYIGDTRTVRPDFYVFNRTRDFVVDVLNAANAITLGPHLRLKARKYQDFRCPVFLVVVNEALSQSTLDHAISVRLRTLLRKNIRVLTFTEFTLATAQFRPYRFEGELPPMARAKEAHRKYHPRNRRR